MRRSLFFLQLAASAIGVAASVLLISLWIRSYWWLDLWARDISSSSAVAVISEQGQLRIFFVVAGPFNDMRDVKEGTAKFEFGRHTFAMPNTPHRIPDQRPAKPSVLREFHWTRYSDGHKIITPHWLLATICAVLAAAPWIRRFNLRTLLIATTIAAAALGLIVWGAAPPTDSWSPRG